MDVVVGAVEVVVGAVEVVVGEVEVVAGCVLVVGAVDVVGAVEVVARTVVVVVTVCVSAVSVLVDVRSCVVVCCFFFSCVEVGFGAGSAGSEACVPATPPVEGFCAFTCGSESGERVVAGAFEPPPSPLQRTDAVANPAAPSSTIAASARPHFTCPQRTRPPRRHAPTASAAARAPITGANLKPCPEQAEQTTTRPRRSSTKRSSGIVV